MIFVRPQALENAFYGRVLETQLLTLWALENEIAQYFECFDLYLRRMRLARAANTRALQQAVKLVAIDGLI